MVDFGNHYVFKADLYNDNYLDVVDVFTVGFDFHELGSLVWI
jgi:hypothetical protein